MKRQSNKGMMTLEAAVILPITLVVTLLVFWTGILLYDRCAVKSALSMGLLRGGANGELGNEELALLVKQRIGEELRERLVLVDAPQVSVTVDYGAIRAAVTGTLTIPALPFYGSAAWDIGAAGETRRLRESQIVRTIHRMDRAIESKKEE